MDIKIDGLSYEVLAQALQQAKEGRLHILGKILEIIPEPRPDFKPNVPRIETVIIPKEMIGAVIGPGGKVIQAIQEETKTVIVIEKQLSLSKKKMMLVLLKFRAPDLNQLKLQNQGLRALLPFLKLARFTPEK